MITVTFPTLSKWSLTGSYVGYAIFAALSFLFAWRFLKEAKG